MADEISNTEIPESETAPLVGADVVSEQEHIEPSTDEMTDDEFESYMSNLMSGVVPEQADTTDTDTEPEEESELVDTADLDETDSTDTEGEPTKTDGYTFKVDGQDITVSDPEDIKRLVERGLHSAAEQQRIQPVRQVTAMLEKNELLDEDKLNFLIDVANGNPDAIRKLVTDKGIDPYSLVNDDEDTKEYSPTDHRVSQGQLKLDDVINEIQDTPTFSQTANVVMEQWDDASKQTFLDNPQYFTVLNKQVADGTYDKIQNEMKSQKLLGKAPDNMSDFDLYLHVGDSLFNGKQTEATTEPAPVEQQAEESAEAKLQEASEIQRRKRAVAPSRSIPSKPKPQTNIGSTPNEIYSGSDEDFIKRTAHLFNNL